MSYNEDELEAPGWIDGDFMKKVLESSGKGENVQIRHYYISPAAAGGDHFASLMFRVTVHFSTEENSQNRISLIIKTMPVVEGLKKKLIESTELFPREMRIYKEVLGKYKEILSKSGCNEPIAPRVLLIDSKPHDTIVLEDLREQGYTMLPKNIPDEYECRLIFSKLAQYHALSLKMKADGYNMNFRGTCFRSPVTTRMDCFKTAPSFMTRVLETIPGFEVYANKMRDVTADILIEKGVETVNRTPLYSVLNHGDFHSRNMMFKKNAFDVISEVILFDFQAPHWGSPAYDLLYMGACIPPQLREITFKHYFNVFIDTLVRIGYKGELPTFDQLQKELDAYIYVDLLFLARITPFAYMDMTSVEMETVLVDKELRRRMYHSEGYVEHLKQIAPAILDKIVLWSQ